jgi:outer membrane protein assembly factor BamB
MLKQLKVVVAFVIVGFLPACQAQGNSPLAAVRFESEPQSKTAHPLAYQMNIEHTGYVDQALHLPLVKLWSVRLLKPGRYPVIANGVVVIVSDNRLIGFDEKTGKKLWSQTAPKGANWVGPAYDNGKVFVDPSEVLNGETSSMYAFDEISGKELWASTNAGQYIYSSAPTAAAGVVYTGGAGGGGTVYAYDESSGSLLWSHDVTGGEDSSPVVTSSGVYVSYSCPQTYGFEPTTGQRIWYYGGPCEGGGGSTPALYQGSLYIGDSAVTSGFDGLVLNATNGNVRGHFNANYVPAFANNVGFFETFTTLEAQSIPKMAQIWAVNTGSKYDDYVTPPLVIGNIVYAETSSNDLIGYDAANGKQKALIKLKGRPLSGYYGGSSFQGLGYGDGELVVPNASYLTAFIGS